MKRKCSWVPILTILCCNGCFSSSVKEEFYYQIVTPSATTKIGKGPRISVADFTAAPGYDSSRVAYRTTNNELRYYGYRQWVSDPAPMLADAVTRHFRASGLFSEVERGDRVHSPDLIIEGNLDALEEVDLNDKWQARLAITLRVRNARSEKIVLEHIFDRTEPCAQTHLNEVAEKASQILAKEMKKLTQRLAKTVVR
ncbi:MAG: ABC-type transport auxiliary lipoprotein family protein [Pseudomonadota bacterium]